MVNRNCIVYLRWVTAASFADGFGEVNQRRDVIGEVEHLGDVRAAPVAVVAVRDESNAHARYRFDEARHRQLQLGAHLWSMRESCGTCGWHRLRSITRELYETVKPEVWPVRVHILVRTCCKQGYMLPVVSNENATSIGLLSSAWNDDSTACNVHQFSGMYSWKLVCKFRHAYYMYMTCTCM